MTTNSQKALLQENLPDLGYCSLPNWGLIFIEGPDAASFLQNQLTNSVLGLTPTPSSKVAQSPSVRLVGYCNPKGRLLASAWLSLVSQENSSDDRFALFISKDIAASIAKRLSMYVLRSKVKVINASDEWSVFGYCSMNDDANSLMLDESQIGLRLPNVQVHHHHYGRVLVAEPKALESFNNQSKVFATWSDLEVLSAIPRIVLATQEQFVPQMVNFESVAGVDFKKGCYPGQEIVARSQYRGVIKRRLSLAHADKVQMNGATVTPGAELFHSEDPSQPAGMVVLSSESVFQPDWIDFQVECKSEALEFGEIRLGSISGPVLKIDPLPYPLIEI